MNCIKCYQEIPEGSKFCPHCGAQQPEMADAGHADIQANTTAQPDTSAQSDTAAQQDTQAQNTQYQDQNTQYQAQNAQYQDPYAQYQDAQNYGTGSQNTYTSDYQNSQYQTPPVYQSSYQPEKPINWVPYLVLSIVTTLCCCLPFGIVGIVYATKINSAMNSGNYEEAQRSARTAKIWIIVAAVVGVIANIIVGVMAAMGAMDSYYYYY